MHYQNINQCASKSCFDCQSTFVKGRLILDNVIMAFETLHSINKCLKEKIGKVTIKIDICKAYDNIEWPFLKFILKKLGFESNFANLIMNYVS